MRIGLFTDTYAPEINGVVSSIVLLENELKKHGHEVFVVTTGNSLFETERQGNVMRLPGVELKQLYGYVLTSPIHFAAMDEIEEMQLDLIHAHTEFGVGIFARLVAKKLNIPLVSTYHTTYEDYTHYVNPINSKSVDKIAKKAVANLSKLYGTTCVEMISPSEKTKEMLLGYGIKTPIDVIPTGIDLQRFDRHNTPAERIEEIRKEAGVSPQECLIVFVGRIAKEKSIDLPIQGVKKLKEDQVPAKLMIIGAGPQTEELVALCEELQVQDCVVFAGKKPADQIPAYYHAADAFVSASLTETQGMTFIEALASNLPVFARPDEVLEGLVLDGETGYLFETPEGFASCVETYLALTEAERSAIKEACKSHVQKYDSRIFYQQVIALYERAVTTYQDYYEVTAIKAKNDYAEVRFENTKEQAKLLVSLETYMDENIRKGGRLSKEQVNRLKLEEEEVKGYEGCIRKLASRDRTCKEMYDYLTQQTELDIAAINRIIEKLTDKGYIDDVKYARSTADTMKGLLQGEHKIFKTLKKKGIPVEIIEEVLDQLKDDESELNNAIEAAEKFQTSIHEKSVRKKKQMIYQKLFNRGFSSEMIEEAMRHLNFLQEEEEELEVLHKTALKAKRRYSSQYAGVRLRNMVFRYCSAQGFDMEDIYLVLSEMEWEDE